MRDHIEQHIHIHTDIASVWDALTTADGLRSWFGDQAEIDLRPGGEARFGWTEFDSSSHAMVEVVERPNRFVFRWAATGTEDVRSGPSTVVEFRLTSTDEGTTVTVIETGFASLPAEIAQRDFKENTSGWTAELKDLEQYLTGIGAG
jgi:uncharacterized protein YndB with AHSA1/START domain